MFRASEFISHSGKPLQFKIECDDLTNEDYDVLAQIINRHFVFGSVFGIPNGGVKLQQALLPYCTKGPRLVVDDVLTTGNSMKQHRLSHTDIGVVIFARGPCPLWVHPIFTLNIQD